MINSNIELLVSGTSAVGSLDLQGDEPIQLDMAIADVRKITSKVSTFSQEFTVPGTKNNNKLFNNIFEIGLDSQFKANKITKCQLLVDQIPVLNNGVLQLISINVDDNRNITYLINVYDQSADLITAMGDALITDLNWSDLNHKWTYSAITNTWTGSSQSYFYPLTDYGYDWSISQMNYSCHNAITGYTKVGTFFIPNYGCVMDTPGVHVSQLFPSTQVKTIVDKTFAASGFSYTSNFFNSTFFKNLYIPYCGSLAITEPNSFATGLQFIAASTTNIKITLPNSTTFGPLGPHPLNFPNTSIPYYPPLSGSGASYINATSKYQVGSVGSIQQFFVTLDVEYSSSTSSNDFQAFLGVEFFRSTYNGGATSFYQTGVLPFNVISTSIQTAQLTFETPLLQNEGNPYFYPTQSGETFWCRLSTASKGKFLSAPTGTSNLYINLGSTFYNLVSTQVVTGELLDYKLFLPQNTKQKDFLESLILMFNLVIVPDNNNPNNYIIEPHDNYYSGGTTLDWSHKIDVSKAPTQQLLSQLSNKRINFTYKEDNDYFNQIYKQSTNYIFGQFYYNVNDDFADPQDLLIQPIFSPTPSVAVLESLAIPPVGMTAATANEFVIPKIINTNGSGNYSNTNYNIRILQKYSGNTISLSAGDSWQLLNDGTGAYVTQTSYPYLGMLDNPSNGGNFDLGFGTVQYEFYALSAITSNNLFNAYWSNYIQGITDPSAKLVTAYIYLTPADIQSFNFNDTIFIDGISSNGFGGYFTVNSIEYVATSNEPSKVTLFQIENKFVPITLNPVNYNPNGNGGGVSSQSIVMGGAQLLSTASIAMGSNSSIGSQSTGSLLLGTNSSIGGGSNDSMILGNNNTINGPNRSTGIFGSGNYIDGGSENSFIFGDDNLIPSGTPNTYIFGNNIVGATGDTVYMDNLEISSGGTINGIPISAFTADITLWSGDSKGNILANNGSGNISNSLNGFAYVEGEGNTASNEAAHAEGSSTTASGGFSHSEGFQTTASGGASHAEGNNSTAANTYSHAEGNATTASGTSSHAEGAGSFALGNNSHAEGSSQASGSTSHSEGNNTFALGNFSHAEGGTNGAYLQSLKAQADYSHAEGENTQALGEASHSEGILTTAAGDFSHAEGYNTTASGVRSHAEGDGNKAIGDFGSHAEGSGTVASGTSSHAEGTNTTALKVSDHAEGTSTTASGNPSHSEGGFTTASGAQSHAEGFGTKATGINSHSEGLNTSAFGSNSHAGGNASIASGLTSFSFGVSNIAQGTATAILGGTNNTAFTGTQYSAIIGGADNVIMPGVTESAVIGGSFITAFTSSYVYVPSLNINTVGSASAINNLGIDINGNLTTNTIGGGGSSASVTAFTYNNANTLTIFDSSGHTYSASINIMTGLTINGTLSATTGNFNTISATTLSATTATIFTETVTNEVVTNLTGTTITTSTISATTYNNLPYNYALLYISNN